MSSISWNELSDSRLKNLSIPNVASTPSIYSAAMSYIECGWYVAPVKSGTKNPGSLLGTDWPSKTSRNPQDIAAWFRNTNHSIALHAGKSRALIFDIDNPVNVPNFLWKHLSQAKVPFQSTRLIGDRTRGHYFFRIPDGVTYGNGLGTIPGGWGDIRSHNAVVIASPSEHVAKDGLYKWQRFGELPMLPAELALRLPQRTAGSTNALDMEEAQKFIHKNSAQLYPELLAQRLSYFRSNPPVPSTRHARFQRLLCLVLKDSAVGLYRAEDALNETQSMFNSYKPEHEQTHKEFVSMALWAMGMVDAMEQTEKNLHISATAPHLDSTLMEWVRSHG